MRADVDPVSIAVAHWFRIGRYCYRHLYDLLREPFHPFMLNLTYRDFKLSKYDTKFRQTRAVLSKLTRLIIETGSVTGKGIALTSVVTFQQFDPMQLRSLWSLWRFFMPFPTSPTTHPQP